MSRDLAEKLIDQSESLECHMFPRVRVDVPVFPPALSASNLKKERCNHTFYFLENTAMCRYIFGW